MSVDIAIVYACVRQVLICQLFFEKRSRQQLFLRTLVHVNERAPWTEEQRRTYFEKLQFLEPTSRSTQNMHLIDSGPLVLHLVRGNEEIRLSGIVFEAGKSRATLETSSEETSYEYYCQQLKLFSCLARCVSLCIYILHAISN